MTIQPNLNIGRVRLKILGIRSEFCINTIKKTLYDIDGIESITYLSKSLIIEYNLKKLVIETIIESIEDIGYGAIKIENN